MRLNHVHFASGDVGATRAFYERFFGFKLHARLRDTTVLVNDDHFLLAIDAAPERAGVEPPAHFGFCVATRDEVEAAYAAMREAGVAFAQELRVLSENAVSFYCEDPAGNRVEVGWYRNL